MKGKHERPREPRRLAQGGVIGVGVVAVVVIAVLVGTRGGSHRADRALTSGPGSTAAPAATAPGTSAATTSTSTTTPAPPADSTTLTEVDRITGHITPKSVVAAPNGLVSAQSMMYSHVVTYYDATTRALVATIPDSVDLGQLGVPGHPGVSKGAPVEAAFTSDGRKEYVSNYSMYGAGFGPEGSDQCVKGDGTDTSYLYRIDVASRRIDQAIHVGAVPKFVAITPDQRYVLVTNWCSWDLSVVDVAQAKEVKRIPLDRYPRGIAVSPDSRTAYVALMGTTRLAAVDLASGAVTTLANPGVSPRQVDISPDGAYLYVTNNASGTVAKVDRASGKVLATVRTGQEPRSMAISSDGRALYVVNYDSSTVTKLRTADLAPLATVHTDPHPIGITYEPTTHTVWVACYGGSILVFSDTTPA